MPPKEKLPFIRFKIGSTLPLSSGCKRGPATIVGLIATMSMLFSFTNFQAAASAKVFESVYHN